MSTNNTAPGKKSQASVKRRKRRPRGVPTGLVAILLVITLFFGGLMGFVINNHTNPYRKQLAEAQKEIETLENYITMAGGMLPGDNAANWVFDASGDTDEFADLAGNLMDDNNDLLWGEDSLLNGMMEMTGEPVVVAEFDGGQLTSDVVIDAYNDEFTTRVFSIDGNSDTLSEDTLRDVLESCTADKILEVRATELGLMELTEEDLADIEAQAEVYYVDQLAFYADLVDTSGMSDADAQQAIASFMESAVGITKESIIEEEKEVYWISKLVDYVTKDVTVSDAEIQSLYDETLAAQRALFSQYPEEFEYAILNGETILYNPEGYRAVKHILLAFPNDRTAQQASDLIEEIALLDPQTSMSEITEKQNQLNALYAELDAEANSIIAQLNAGADFDALIAQYGEDAAMEAEPTKSKGYYVSANSIQWSTDFVEGCMMLEEIGQISTPIHSIGGVHIIKYIDDVTPGDVSLNDVLDAIRTEALTLKKESVYQAQVSEWIANANIKYYPERLQ